MSSRACKMVSSPLVDQSEDTCTNRMTIHGPITWTHGLIRGCQMVQSEDDTWTNKIVAHGQMGGCHMASIYDLLPAAIIFHHGCWRTTALHLSTMDGLFPRRLFFLSRMMTKELTTCVFCTWVDLQSGQGGSWTAWDFEILIWPVYPGCRRILNDTCVSLICLLFN
jgi:hypothetical protein